MHRGLRETKTPDQDRKTKRPKRGWDGSDTKNYTKHTINRLRLSRLRCASSSSSPVRVTRAIDSFLVIPGDSRPFFSPLFLFFFGLARQPRRDSGVEIDLQIKPWRSMSTFVSCVPIVYYRLMVNGSGSGSIDVSMLINCIQLASCAGIYCGSSVWDSALMLPKRDRDPPR